MNNEAKAAYNQYKDLVTAWGRDVNMAAYENGMQLIQWIEDKRTGSDQQTRQDVKAANWESLLSGFPTESLQGEMNRRIAEEAHGTISSDCPVCPGCGKYMTIEKHGNAKFEYWESHCECIIGQEIEVPYESTREELIKKQNEANLAWQCK